MEQIKAVETAKMLIKFYNMQAGTAFRAGSETNQSVVVKCINSMHDDIAGIKSHIRAWVAERQAMPALEVKCHSCKTLNYIMIGGQRKEN